VRSSWYIPTGDHFFLKNATISMAWHLPVCEPEMLLVVGTGRGRLVPDTMTAIGNGRPVVIRNPSATRPWQHVLVPLSGYLGLAEKLWDDGKQYVGGWNFGPSD